MDTNSNSLAPPAAPEATRSNSVTLFVFSGDWDKVYSAFIIATSAAASGMEVNMFFTFWATSTLKKHKLKEHLKKDWIEWAFGLLLPRGSRKLQLSKFNFLGFGLFLMKTEMKKKQFPTLEDLITSATDLGVKMTVCDMSMDIIGIKRAEIDTSIPGVEFSGAASFIEKAAKANITMYI